MIKYSDIISNVNLILKNNFPEVHRIENSVRSGFEKPAFFVQLLPITENSYNDYSEKIVVVNIHYFSKQKTDLDIIGILDSLNNVFKSTINISDRILTIKDKSYILEENVLQFKFTLDFVDDLEETEQYETMQELYLESEVD